MPQMAPTMWLFFLLFCLLILLFVISYIYFMAKDVSMSTKKDSFKLNNKNWMW